MAFSHNWFHKFPDFLQFFLVIVELSYLASSALIILGTYLAKGWLPKENIWQTQV